MQQPAHGRRGEVCESSNQHTGGELLESMLFALYLFSHWFGTQRQSPVHQYIINTESLHKLGPHLKRTSTGPRLHGHCPSVPCASPCSFSLLRLYFPLSRLSMNNVTPMRPSGDLSFMPRRPPPLQGDPDFQGLFSSVSRFPIHRGILEKSLHSHCPLGLNPHLSWGL